MQFYNHIYKGKQRQINKIMSKKLTEKLITVSTKEINFGDNQLKTLSILNITTLSQNPIPILYKIKATDLTKISLNRSQGYISGISGQNQVSINIRKICQQDFKIKILVMGFVCEELTQQIVDSNKLAMNKEQYRKWYQKLNKDKKSSIVQEIKIILIEKQNKQTLAEIVQKYQVIEKSQAQALKSQQKIQKTNSQKIKFIKVMKIQQKNQQIQKKQKSILNQQEEQEDLDSQAKESQLQLSFESQGYISMYSYGDEPFQKLQKQDILKKQQACQDQKLKLDFNFDKSKNKVYYQEQADNDNDNEVIQEKQIKQKQNNPQVQMLKQMDKQFDSLLVKKVNQIKNQQENQEKDAIDSKFKELKKTIPFYEELQKKGISDITIQILRSQQILSLNQLQTIEDDLLKQVGIKLGQIARLRKLIKQSL